jgi:4'-phosphopantetheinyl transferase
VLLPIGAYHATLDGKAFPGTSMELWLVDLPAAVPALEALERQVPRLSADDRTRAARLREERERRQRLAAYIALRIIIERIGGAHVRQQAFMRTASGRPHLGEAAPSFSLSHSGRWALLGIARSPIGVDLEAHRCLKMSARRRQEVLAIGAGLAQSLAWEGTGKAPVLQAWCRLEAYAKATGQGLAHILAELGLHQASGRQLVTGEIEAAARRLADAGGMAVRDLKLPPGLCGAVACSGVRRLARVRRFPADRAAIVRLFAGHPPRAASGGRRKPALTCDGSPAFAGEGRKE